MSRTVTALYDTKAEAEAARQRLASAVDVEGRAQILDQSTAGGQDGGRSGSSALHQLPLSHEDRHAYGEGIRRGGFMLCAHVDGDEDADKIVHLLEETSSVDLDSRQNEWRNEGWQGYAGAGNETGMSQPASAFSQQRQPQQGMTGSSAGTTGQQVAEEHIPIVEEELIIGKREVSRGGARVRSYVRETPVHEQVTLREEHVNVERRPVDQKLDRGALDRDPGLLQGRTVEMTETSEEAVVGKEARVREEVVVRKTADQHVENIDDTVRRTEVEVDENLGSSTAGHRNEGGTFGSGSDLDRN